MKSFLAISLIFISNHCFCQFIDSLPNDSLAKNKRLEFFPIPILLHSPETSFGFGAGGVFTFKSSKKDSAIRTSNINLFGLYTLNKQIVCLTDGAIYLPKENYILKFQGSFSQYPDKFWGVGNDSPDSNEEDYSYTQYYFHPQMVRKTRSSFFAGLSYEIQNIIKLDHSQTGLFNQQNITGKEGGKISGGGLLIAWDNRNNAFSPNKGEFIQLSASHFNNFLGSDFDYSSYSLDIRKYLQTVRKQVFVIQTVSQMNTGAVPFRSMASIGGENLMRGYYSGRFRDNNMLALQTEYRIPVWKRLGAVIFSGIGEVSDRIKQYSISGLKYTFGGGIRFALKKKDRLNLRLDYGQAIPIAIGTNGVYFLLSEAF